MKTKIVFFVIALAAAAVLFWVFNPARGTSVDSVTPVKTKAVQAVYATGTVEASRMIPVSPRIAARLMVLDVDEGAKVESGQTLAQLEDTDIRQNLAELEARLALASSDFERAEKLSKSGAISKSGFDSAMTNFTAATAAVERAKAELGYLQLVAPEAGTIIRRDGEIGEMMVIGTPVFWMSGGNAMRIETEVDEEDIGLVKVGQNVIVRADAFPDQTFEGKVQSITPKGDPVARSYRVRVGVSDESPLMIGMTAETNIITQIKENALMVPAAAVSNGNVVKLSGGKAILTPVKTGIKTPDAIEILEGVAEGEHIAAKFDSTLADKGNIHSKAKDWKPAQEAK